MSRGGRRWERIIKKNITALCKKASKRLSNGEVAINTVREEFNLVPIDKVNVNERLIELNIVGSSRSVNFSNITD